MTPLPMAAADEQQQADPAVAAHEADSPLLESPEQVLATLNKDGTRRWLRPRLSPGTFLRWRKVVAYGLIGIFVVLPFLKLGGKPVMLLDVIAREFHLLGITFRPTDTPYLMVMMLALFVGIFLTTALLGRAWCGWACPQTVYMEFLFRPLERLFEGSPQESLRLDREGANLRRVLKNGAFLIASFFLANVFLSYFVGVERLGTWILEGPLSHPEGFSVVMVVTAAMMIDFGYMREQTCLVACPYGRFQSVMLDRHSLIVGYDETRGEPRGKPRKKGDSGEPRGDCIDCGACVITCPTGIDIRNGLQMECIGCTQCIDACDSIMTKLKRPLGLIRYSSQAELAGQPKRFVRARVIAYSVIVTVLLGVLAVALSNRSPVKVTLLRMPEPYAIVEDGLVQNVLRLKVENLQDAAHSYTIRMEGIEQYEGASLTVPQDPLEVGPQGHEETLLLVRLPRSAYEKGGRQTTFVVEDGQGFSQTKTFRLLGPKH